MRLLRFALASRAAQIQLNYLVRSGSSEACRSGTLATFLGGFPMNLYLSQMLGNEPGGVFQR
jgi:hypothetical protein